MYTSDSVTPVHSSAVDTAAVHPAVDVPAKSGTHAPLSRLQRRQRRHRRIALVAASALLAVGLGSPAVWALERFAPPHTDSAAAAPAPDPVAILTTPVSVTRRDR